MKNSLLFAILITSVHCFGQTNLDQLKMRKNYFKNQLKSYNDSLKQIELRITEEENAQLIPVNKQFGFTPAKVNVTNPFATIFKEEKMLESIGTAPYGGKVKIIGIGQINPRLFKVEFEGLTGFMLESDLNVPNEIKKQQSILIAIIDNEKKKKKEADQILAEQNKQLILAKELAEKDSTRKKWVEINQEIKTKMVNLYGKAIAEKILSNQLWIGMTSEMAKNSIGQPDKINKTIRANSISEQWVYNNRYLYFDDGILTTIQDSK